MPVLPKIPETITVHLGLPDSNAGNITIPFTSYIKNVASNELYPTWPENALRANIYAQISFALNRIYTEFYPSRGYDFDITSTTARDQIYVLGGNVYENISRLVDNMFNDYIVRQGNIEPLFAAFCDGAQTQCAGLSQWGSVSLAEQGYIPYAILQHYYGSNINLVFDAPVGESVPSYPGRPLRRGDFGQDVRTIQQQLLRIRRNYPALPAPNLNSLYDTATEEAVRGFQEVFNLQSDGIVGKSTWYKIKAVWGGVKQLSELGSEGLTITEAQRVFPAVLRYGDRGVGVRTVQYYLAFLGFFLPALPSITMTGVFDDATRDAVYAFQRSSGLAVDGIVGRDTWNALQRDYESLLRELPEEYREFLNEIYPGRFLVQGDTGQSVVQLQTNLQRIAGKDNTIPTVSVTGTFDAATATAVRAMQRQLGLDPTGAVGPIVWREIMTRGNDL
ncbi:MAG: peptidoglycan-binding protein [Oscillospiraceae bacterium]|nr:peptidoglycan-binding protein [Oscillospiraceae bacterium]